MAYIISYESSSVDFPRYVKTRGGNDIVGVVSIKGGAYVIDKKTLETPKGVITEVTKEELEFLKTQYLFNEKVKYGSYEIVESEGKAKERVKKSKKEKDAGAQLTAQDFKDAGQDAPIVGANEKPDDGSVLEKKMAEQ